MAEDVKETGKAYTFKQRLLGHLCRHNMFLSPRCTFYID